MRISPLFTGIVYISFGALFTAWAIQLVNSDGWGVFVYLLLIIATFDIGAGIRIITFYIRMKNKLK